MKTKMLVFTIIVFFSACTSLQPVNMSPVQIQDNIASKGLVKEGAQVKVVTANGKEYEFEVTSISDTHISGNEVSIPIKDVVALEISEIDGLETTFLTGGIIALAVGFLLAASIGL